MCGEVDNICVCEGVDSVNMYVWKDWVNCLYIMCGGVESVNMYEEVDSVFIYVYYVKEWIVYLYIFGGLDSVCMYV